MKKVMLLLVAIGFIATVANTKSSSLSSANVLSDKSKACIEACNTCITSCKKVEAMYAMGKNAEMAECAKLCKECVTAYQAC